MEHWADYVIFAVFLLISIGIGLYHALTGGRQRTTEEFLMGDRKLKVLPTTISLLVSYQSAIMILGGTAEMYVGGTMAWFWNSLYFFGSLIVTAKVIVPWLYPLKLTSIYRIFELRYGTQDVRIFSAALGVLVMVLYMGTAMFAPSVALETATGFPARLSIPIMAVVCIIYTSLGGMKAVIWTDVFQFLIMIIGMLGVMIKGFMVVGGFRTAFELIQTEGRLTIMDWSPDPTVRHTFWGFTIGSTLSWINIYGLSQSSVQRFCAVESMTKAQMSLYFNMPPLFVMTCITSLTGVAVVAYFIRFQCDPIISGEARYSNELLPLFVKEMFRDTPGFSGLFMATLYSGALSSVSSSLSASAAITWDDILAKQLPHITDYRASVVNKAIVVIYGVLAIGVSFLIARMKGPIMQISMSVGSAVAGPLFGIFVLSSIKKLSWCSSKPVLIGGILGLAFNFWIICGSSFVSGRIPPLPPLSVDNCTFPAIYNYTAPEHHPLTGLDRFYTISYIWYALSGAMVTVVCGLVISAVFYKCQADDKKQRDIPDGIFINFSWNKKSQSSDIHESGKNKVELVSYENTTTM